MTLSRCLLIEIRAKHDQPIDWVGPTQPPGSHPPPTRDAAHGNTLGLKVTAESKKKYMKKSCVVDKYRRMAGYVEISCKKGAENRRTVESFWNEI